MGYRPPFTITGKIATESMEIARILEQTSTKNRNRPSPRLRRINRLKSIHSSLAIEKNSLTLGEVKDVIEGKLVIGPEKEIQEVRNAFAAYELIDSLNPFKVEDLLKAHSTMMKFLVPHEGEFRKGGEGVFDADGNCIHMAPPAKFVPGQMSELLKWLRDSDYPLLIKSCVFHYEFEFIHPFEDGNGRTGRLWHTLILSKVDEIFKWIPIESMIRSHQEEYYSAIAESNEKGDSTVFVEFMISMILGSLVQFQRDASKENLDTDLVLTTPETAVLSCIKDGEFSSIASAAGILGISTATVTRAIASLKEKGLIYREGANKNGKWYLKETNSENHTEQNGTRDEQ